MKWFILGMLLWPLTMSAQPWGRYFQAGTTYTGYQHNGSCGRMIGVDDGGYVHVVWMNGLTPSLQPRHVYYNVWDPTSESFSIANGSQVDATPRAGYTTMAVAPGGFGYPVFHESIEHAHTVAAIDFLPRSGAFTSSEPDWIYEKGQEVENIWPVIAYSMDGKLQVVSTENRPNGEALMRLYYSRGQPIFDPDEFGMDIAWDAVGNEPNAECALIDTTCVVAATIAASSRSNRVAIAWLRPRNMANVENDRNDNDLCLILSEDGGLDWSPWQNVTNFIPPDEACFAEYGDWRCCSRDTIRPYRDISLLFDNADMLQVAFTAVARYQWTDTLEGPIVQPTKAQIWHWNESNESFKLVAESWIEDSLLSDQQHLPLDRAMVERPSLSKNDQGLFCLYAQYDTAAYSEAGYLNADLLVSKLGFGETDWSVGTNVTITRPTQIPAPPGENLNEIDATLAERATVDNALELLHAFYELDVNANGGAAGSDENLMYYQQIEIIDISGDPVMPAREFHVIEQPCGTSVSPERDAALLPKVLSLAAYPNPFNSTATMNYDLPKSMNVKLAAYDVLGREIATLFHGRQSAGSHVATWSPEHLSSGIYFIRMDAERELRTLKVMYLK